MLFLSWFFLFYEGNFVEYFSFVFFLFYRFLFSCFYGWFSIILWGDLCWFVNDFDLLHTVFFVQVFKVNIICFVRGSLSIFFFFFFLSFYMYFFSFLMLLYNINPFFFLFPSIFSPPIINLAVLHSSNFIKLCWYINIFFIRYPYFFRFCFFFILSLVNGVASFLICVWLHIFFYFNCFVIHIRAFFLLLGRSYCLSSHC